MTETHPAERTDNVVLLEQRIVCLEKIVVSFHRFLTEENYFGALFLIENLSEEHYDNSSLYARLVFELAEKLDVSDEALPRGSISRPLSEALLNYLKSQCKIGEYFKKSDPFGE